MYFTINQNITKDFSTDNFTSPFLDEVKDDYQLRLTYNRYNVVPFFGTALDSSDTVLKTLYRISEVTPIYQGALDIIREFSISAGLKLHKSEGLGILNTNFIDATAQENNNFEKECLSILVDTNLLNISDYLMQSLVIDGNGGLKVSVDKLSGKTKIKHVHTTTFKYNISIFEGVKMAMICDDWQDSSITADKIETIPVFPAFNDEEGLCTTFIHIKNVNANRRLYGLSNSASSLMQQYSSNQLFTYISAAIENRFTGQVFLDSELDDTDQTGKKGEKIKSFNNDIKNTFTNKGSKKSSVISRFRTKGLQPTNVTQFKSNTDYQFYEAMTKILNESIIQSLPIDRRLIFESNGLFGENLDAVNQFQSQKVKHLQNLICAGLNQCFDFIESCTNKEIRGGNILALKSTYIETTEEEEGKGNKENEKE